MLKHYVEFFTSHIRAIDTSTLWGGDDIRDIIEPIKVSGAIEVPKKSHEEALKAGWSRNYIVGDYDAYRFFDQNEVECENGEVLVGKKDNFSGWRYIGKEITTEKRLQDTYGDKYERNIRIWNGVRTVRELDACWTGDEEEMEEPWAYVITVQDNVYPLYKKDFVFIGDKRINYRSLKDIMPSMG